jgi:hypothetical protein
VTALGAIGTSNTGLSQILGNKELAIFFSDFIQFPSMEQKIATLKAIGEILERKYVTILFLPPLLLHFVALSKNYFEFC